MESQTIFAALRDALAFLYPTEQEARVVVDDAEVVALQIAFSPRSQTNWHNILGEALRQNRLDALLEGVHKAYQNNEEFSVAYATYCDLLARGGHLDAPPPILAGSTQTIETSGGMVVMGNVTTGSGDVAGRDLTKIEHHYYYSTEKYPSPSPLPSMLDEQAEVLPLGAGRTQELAKLHEWYEAALTDKKGEAPRLVVIAGPQAMGKRELLQQWRTELGQRDVPPTVAVTSYLPPYVTRAQQEFYYSDHPGWRQAWAAYATAIRRRYSHAEALGGLAWVALAAQLVQQSPAAQSKLKQSAPAVGDLDERMIRQQMSELLLAAIDDGPLVLIVERVDHAQYHVLQPLLRVWLNRLHDLPFLLVLLIDTPQALDRGENQSQGNDWLTWLRVQTAPNAPKGRYLPVGPLNRWDIDQLLMPDSQDLAAALHYITNGVPALLRELLLYWQQQEGAEQQADGRWHLQAEAFSTASGSIYQQYIEEPLQDCAARAQALGYDVDWETLLDWLQYAVWEGDTFTDEALAHAIDMHGAQLETFQELIDAVLVQQEDDDNPSGLLVELAATVALPTAEAEYREHHMARYRFNPPLLAGILFHRQHGQARMERGSRYLNALQATYHPFVDQIAPLLVQRCNELGRSADAAEFMRLIAPPAELAQVNATVAAMRALAMVEPGVTEHLIRYVVDFVADAHGKIHARPLLTLLEQAVKFPCDALIIKARLLWHLGWCHSDLGEAEQALSYYNQALPIQRQVGDRSGEAATLHGIGSVYHALGEPQQALSYYNQALLIRCQVGDRRGEAATLHGIGAVYHALGEPEQALSYCNQALPILRQVGDRSGEAHSLHDIGSVYSALGEAEQALSYFNQALPIARQVGDRRGEAATLYGIGVVYDTLGEAEQALTYYNQALPIRRQVGDRSGEAATLTNIGTVYYNLGEPEQALTYYNQALPICQKIGDRLNERNIRYSRAVVHERLSQLDQAEADLLQVVALDESLHQPSLEKDREELRRIQALRQQSG